MQTLTNKVVWITGASSGLGEALSYAFAREGCRLILSARRMDQLVRVKNNCIGASGVEVFPLDLAVSDDLPAGMEKVLEAVGHIDILINNAGVSQRSLSSDTDFNVYRRILEINFFGTIKLSRLVVDYFEKRNRGQLVVISSVAGKAGLPFRSAYSASKHALEGFFGALRVEIHKSDIKLLIVRPGAIRTNIAVNALQGDGGRFGREDALIEKGMDANDAANAIVKAVRMGRKELELGSFAERLFLVLCRYFPGISYTILKKMMNGKYVGKGEGDR